MWRIVNYIYCYLHWNEYECGRKKLSLLGCFCILVLGIFYLKPPEVARGWSTYQIVRDKIQCLMVIRFNVPLCFTSEILISNQHQANYFAVNLLYYLPFFVAHHWSNVFVPPSCSLNVKYGFNTVCSDAG